MALLLHRKKPDYWDGAVLVAPMCKVCLNFLFLFQNELKCFLNLKLKISLFLADCRGCKTKSNSCTYIDKALQFYTYMEDYSNPRYH